MGDTDPAAAWRAIPAQVSAIGPNFDSDVLRRTAALYAPLVRRQSREGVRTQRDIAYGPHERHRLDLFQPDVSGAPMVIFIHGGGFVFGDKNADGDFYTNIGVYFARHGMLAVTANYRRAPDHVWPAGAEDVRAVVGWARANAMNLMFGSTFRIAVVTAS